ncbi:MAG: SGNH/GDSL hydrolase family protein [Algoriphagus aquaeductus]|uniref:SGNH/GDSL hydrolase family protein n=1 Tax=Algoriphagus aquaeductus TaxID=475299 RepID=UPI00387997BE
MKKRITLFLFTWIVVFFLCETVFSQTQWKNPLEAGFSVIEGRLDNFREFNRLPEVMKDSVRTEVWNLSHQSAGLSISFKTEAPKIEVVYSVSGPLQLPHMPSTGVSGLDLYGKSKEGTWYWLRGNFQFGDTIRYEYQVESERHTLEEFRLFLPLYNQVENLAIGFEPGFSLEFQPIPTSPPVVIYGTSIAQGACASRPALAWTAILRRELDQPVVNLGFSGNGLLEKELIHFIGQKEASLFVLDCLPNLVPGKGLSDKDIRNRLWYAVQYLRQKHPHTPILLTDHAGYSDGEVDSSRKETYEHLNLLLAEEYRNMKKEGVSLLFHLEKDQISLTEEDFVDGTHPTDGGMLKYAKAYIQKIREIQNQPFDQ